MFTTINTADLHSVERLVTHVFQELYPSTNLKWLPTIFKDITALFRGENPEYCPCDARYHDLEHTLQAVVCLSALMQGRHNASTGPKLNAKYFELAIAAALLHDTGYIKLRTDVHGTGAKYTYCHVVRSCAFAASYLPSLQTGCNEIDTVLAAINCTGPANEISRIKFPHRINKIIGASLATADFLGQMAASDYPDKLGILFAEFEESDEFIHLPKKNRAFKSARDLTERTPAFWAKYVLPKLDSDFEGVYKFLATPEGRNPYIERVENNMLRIRQMISA